MAKFAGFFVAAMCALAPAISSCPPETRSFPGDRLEYDSDQIGGRRAGDQHARSPAEIDLDRGRQLVR